MAGYKPKVISLTKRPGQTFGFYLRVEQEDEGHLVRSLEMGGPAELAGMKDGDRIIRVNGTFTDQLSHSEVVDLVRDGGATVTFHILDEASYKQAKKQGVNLCSAPTSNGAAKEAPKPKLCYLVKSTSGFGCSLRSVKSERGLFMIEVVPGSVAYAAGVRVNDRLLEVDGESVEDSAHSHAVDKIKQAGSSVMLLLLDEEADRFYRNKRVKVVAGMATAKYLRHKPRLIEMTKGADGYGFLLREEPNKSGHSFKDVDPGSPAQRAGLKERDRLVAVDGHAVDGCSHEQVVDRIKRSGDKCRLLVVDEDTDQMFKKGKVSPLICWEETNDSHSLPSYTEALLLPAPVRTPTPVPHRGEELRPKLCRMEKTSAGYGFRLNGIQGVHGQYIMEVVKGGAADRAGMEDQDVVVEVAGVNVEKCSHEEVVDMIRDSGGSLEMLVAKKSVYDQLKADGVAVTRLLLGETTCVQVHTADAPEGGREEARHQEARAESPPQPARERNSSVSSDSSVDSMDEQF